jgi:hypothetical protein
MFNNYGKKMCITLSQKIRDNCDQAIAGIREAADMFSKRDGELHLEYLFRFRQLQQELDEELMNVGEALDTDSIPVYTAGSLFLQESYRYLTKGPYEHIHYVTGLTTGNTLSLDRIVTFKLARQHLAGVEGDTADTVKALMKLDRFGHKLLGWFHSHPGSGAGAVYPSAVDIGHQRRLEIGGYPSIGAIFSRDGYVRFFSVRRAFEVEIYGKGVEQIDEKHFRIELDQD